jgi:hypothetical protein
MVYVQECDSLRASNRLLSAQGNEMVITLKTQTVALESAESREVLIPLTPTPLTPITLIPNPTPLTPTPLTPTPLTVALESAESREVRIDPYGCIL